MPVPSLLSQCRPRLGEARVTRVFNEIRRQGRAQGLVKARLRVKDAPHLIANSAIPSPWRLVAQPRAQRLQAAEGFAATEVATQRAQVEAGRAATADLPEEQRLLARVTHLRELVIGGEPGQHQLRETAAGPPPVVSEEPAAAWSAALERAPKVLNDRELAAKDKLLALADKEARTGHHGDYDDGDLLDVSMDADSALSGAVAV